MRDIMDVRWIDLGISYIIALATILVLSLFRVACPQCTPSFSELVLLIIISFILALGYYFSKNKTKLIDTTILSFGFGLLFLPSLSILLLPFGLSFFELRFEALVDSIMLAILSAAIGNILTLLFSKFNKQK